MPEPYKIWGPDQEGWEQHNFDLVHGTGSSERLQERQILYVPIPHTCPDHATVADATYHAQIIEREIEKFLQEIRTDRKTQSQTHLTKGR